MPAATADDWAVIGRRIGQVPAALAGYRASLAEGAGRGLYAAPRQVETVAAQLGDWLATGGGRLVRRLRRAAPRRQLPATLRADLEAASACRRRCGAALRDWLPRDYLPGAAGTPDGVGEERYLAGARRWNGARLDLAEAYDWGWSQYRQILAEMRTEAEKILPGSTPLAGDAATSTPTARCRRRRSGPGAAAAADGRGDDQPGGHALRSRRPDQGGRGEDRPAGQRGRAVLHRAVAGLLPAGPDLAADARQDHVPDVGADQHLVPRGRARPSPAARAVAVPRRAAVAVPDQPRRRERMLGGLGAVRRAADGRARLPGRHPARGWATWTPS